MDEAYIGRLIEGFEDGTFPGAEFRHPQHLAVAVHYSLEDTAPMDSLRTNIRRYNVSQGGENTDERGYHETITRFWLEVVGQYMSTLPSGLSRVEITRRVVEEFASQRQLFVRYYDFDVLKSREARTVWIAPDRPLFATLIHT